MFCKIFFSYSGENKFEIFKHLEKIHSSYRVITTNILLSEFLKKNSLESATVLDMFHDIGQSTYDIIKEANLVLSRYKELYRGVRYNEFEIFSGIENELREELILLEKAKKILAEKKSTIFVFDGFSFTYFSILKAASDLGYDVDDEFCVGLLHKSKITLVKPEDDHARLYYKNKLQAVNFSLSQSSSKMYLATKLVSLKLKKISNINMQKILERIDKKIQNTQFKNTAKVAFFFTTDIDDFLRAFYPVLDKLKQDKVAFQIFTIDLATRFILSERKIPFVDLFEEVYLASDSIRKIEDVKILLTQIEQIAIKNNLSLFYVRQFSAFFYEQICRVAAIMSICNHILGQMHLKSIGIAIDGSMFGNSVITVAKKYRITTVTVEPSIINEKLERPHLYKADIICIYGLQGQETLKKLGYSEEKIVPTGNPRYDYVRDSDSIKAKNALSRIYKINQNKKLIVVAMGRWHKNDEEWMSKLIKFCNKNDFEIIIKVHPIYKTKFRDFSEYKINMIRKMCDTLSYVITYESESSVLLAAADLVITDYSNMGVEAMLLEKPLFTVNFVGEDLAHVQRFHDYYGKATYSENYFEVENLILKIIKENPCVKELSGEQKRIAERYNFHNDGNASKRIYNILVGKPDT